MNKPSRALIVDAVLFAVSLAAHADAPAGRWEGQIDVPGNPLAITVDLESIDEVRWVGQIAIPVQGLTDFPLGDVEVEGSSVSFAMPGIPGDPVFRGTITEEATVLAGELSQGGATMPFRLERSGDAAIDTSQRIAEVSADLAAALAGRWEGSLEVPGRPLRVAFLLVDDGDGRLTGTFDSPDEGRAGMPLSGLSVNGGTVLAELSYAGAVFEGTVNDARTEIPGEWRQGGGALPLVLRKAAPIEAERAARDPRP